MVPVAQRLERRTVDAEAEGSKPFRHPSNLSKLVKHLRIRRRFGLSKETLRFQKVLLFDNSLPA